MSTIRFDFDQLVGTIALWAGVIVTFVVAVCPRTDISAQELSETIPSESAVRSPGANGSVDWNHVDLAAGLRYQRSAKSAIYEKLAQRTTTEFEGATLAEALRMLAKDGAFNLWLEKLPSSKAKFRVNAAFEDVAYGEVLNRLLKPHQLGFVVEDEVVKVLPQHRIQDDALVNELYNVRPLVNAGFSSGHLADLIPRLTSGPWECVDAFGGIVQPAGDILLVRHRTATQHEVSGLLQALLDVGTAHGERKTLLLSARDPAVEKALNQTISVSFDRVPLHQAVATFAELGGIPFRIDEKALREGGIQEVPVISAQLENVSLHSILNLVLGRIGLTYFADHGAIVITTAICWEPIRELALFGVRDLSDAGYFNDRLIELLVIATHGPWETFDGTGGLMLQPTRNVLVVRHTRQNLSQVAHLLEQLRKAIPRKPDSAELRPTTDTKAHLVTRIYRADLFRGWSASDLERIFPRFVAPATWKKEDFAIASLGDETLLVRHTPNGHAELRRFLKLLPRKRDVRKSGLFGGDHGHGPKEFADP